MARNPYQPLELEPEDIVRATDDELRELLRGFDVGERDDRVRRLRDVNRILVAGPGDGYWHSGGEEASWVLSEAKDAYIYGMPIASLFASHAACERRLAGIVASRRRPPSGSDQWGLGRLTGWAGNEGWLPRGFAERLERIAARRKVLGHYRNVSSKDSFVRRAIAQADNAGRFEVDVPGTLEADALDALATAYDLYAEIGARDFFV
jgi:hypothetical protein